MSIRDNLYKWRDSECARKGIEAFRVLPNTTLDEIAIRQPKTKDELCSVKGIKDMKFSQYGEEILKIINGENVFIEATETGTEEKLLSVSEYLNIINSEISRIHSRIKGEVVTFQTSGNAIYFTIKDTEADAILSIFMWSSDYKLSGVIINSGLEVIVEGHSGIYKPSGRFSLRASTIELVGEGALRVAYEKLKNDLEKEGLFDEKKKIKIKQYPTNIGVITSKQGAVIHDFLNNLGKYGYKVFMMDSRVEGVLAIKDLLFAINNMSRLDLDALVIIRGGGSLESLQAFNNEHVVRAIANLKTPVICAIGHDKDVPLAQLVADYAPSTPSMCTSILNESWNYSKYLVDSYSRTMISVYEKSLQINKNATDMSHAYLNQSLIKIKSKISFGINSMVTSSKLYEMALNIKMKEIIQNKNYLLTSYPKLQELLKDRIAQIVSILEAYDPIRQLKMGYSLVYLDRKVLKSSKSVKIGDTILAELSDGKILAEVIKIENNDKERY